MAYAQLKSDIAAVIRNNGNQEITGNVLQGALLEMINALGANYQYAGVADTSTTITTTEANVFYLLTEAGTYANMSSSIVHQSGIGIALWNGTAWSYQNVPSSAVVATDATPTANSTNPVQSGGVYGFIHDILGVIDYTTITGSRITATGAIYNEANASRSDYIDISGLDYIYLTNPNSVKLEYDAFYNSSKTFITGSRFEVPANAVMHKVVVPSGAKYCIVSVRNSGYLPLIYKNGLLVSDNTNEKDIVTLTSGLAECVKYVSQSLTTSQKTQARTNIGAASSAAETSISKITTGEYVSSGSVNDINTAGGYLLASSVADLPTSDIYLMFVVASNSRFIQKYAFGQTDKLLYYTLYDTSNHTALVNWTLLNPTANIATFGKKIVCFGDSLLGNYDDTSGTSEGVVSFMSRYGYATTYNCAFGGTTASLRGINYWDDMSFVSLVDAIVANDFTAQDTAVASSTEFPAAFATHLATLKAIDWANIDIVCVEYGANDFASNKAIGDNTSNKNNYTGALLYGISKLQEEYPHIKFVLLSPCWRWYKDASGYYDHDSDTEQNTLNLKVTDYVEACLNLGDILHIPSCDDYYKMGINKYNYQGYFNVGTNADGAHHKLFGRQTLAHRIVAFINANC